MLAWLLLSFLVEAMLTGQGALAAARLSAGNLFQAFALTWIYRRSVGDSWAPRTPHELLALMRAAFVAAALALLVGAAPGVNVFQADPVVWWWLPRSGVYSFVTGMTVLVLLNRSPDWSILRQRPWVIAALSVANPLGVALAYSNPSEPRSWVILVPAVWAGMVLRPWGAALSTLLVGVCASAYTLLPHNQFGYGGALPPATLMDLLIISGCYITQLLAMLREEAHQRAGMLNSMFQGMTDGMVVFDDRETAIVQHNASAVRLFGMDPTLARALALGGAAGCPFNRRNPDALPGPVVLRDPARGAGVPMRVLLRNQGTPESGTVLEVTGRQLLLDSVPQTLLLSTTSPRNSIGSTSSSTSPVGSPTTYVARCRASPAGSSSAARRRASSWRDSARTCRPSREC